MSILLLKKLLLGVAPEKAVSLDAMSNPEVMEFFMAFAAEKA